jgi:hypothetical protein
MRRADNKNKTKRLSREVIAPLIRRPNAASAKSHLMVPYWAYSLQDSKRRRRTLKKKTIVRR